MYQYSDKDKQIVKNRTKEFLSQVKRRIDGNLTEEEFKPLRLMNGLYLQLHAYMLRVAIPYGELSHIQLNKLAEISEKYDSRERIGGTLGSILFLLMQGVQIFRVHNVKEVKQGILVFKRILTNDK